MKTQIDIGVSIPVRDSSFMDSIMASDIADSGMESTGDVFFEDNQKCDKKMTDAEFDAFLEECGIGAERFKQW
ncbi:hypothetical protein [uncultured Helicobacter sp.]|uniref:hypothetical protein n=1 Tax=uncultured Helicobacter sp. TaxID=175537 RepID=UPI002614DDC5|nr:hypothetical protein [uncultured Helicobacter sp.]